MADIVPFPKKNMCVRMNFTFDGESWTMDYIFDHGSVHFHGEFTNDGNPKFNEAVYEMTRVFTEQFCASSDQAG